MGGGKDVSFRETCRRFDLVCFRKGKLRKGRLALICWRRPEGRILVAEMPFPNARTKLGIDGKSLVLEINLQPVTVVFFRHGSHPKLMPHPTNCAFFSFFGKGGSDNLDFN